MRSTRIVLCTVAAVAVASSSVSALPLVEGARGALFGALVGDALTLGTHYEYDAKKIRSFYGRIDRFYAPGEKTGGATHGVGWGARNYHGGNGNGPAKRAGETTDYGDYTLLTLEHLAATADRPRPIDPEELVPRWKRALAGWRSWICTQTKQTYQQIQSGVPLSQVGGNSNAMALRAAAALGYYGTEEEVVAAFRTAMFTHRETTAHQGAEFFARVTYRILHSGLTPRAAIEQVSQEPGTPGFVKTKVQQALDKVSEATDPSRPLASEEFADDLALTSMARLWDVGRTEPIKVGKASPTEGTLPGSVYLIVKYENDLMAALQANAEIGGDNASRSQAVGMVLGAYHGARAIPAPLMAAFVDAERVEKLFAKLPLVAKEAAATTTKGSAPEEL